MQTLPRTLLIQIRFRCRDAALSATVVNALIRAYGEQDTECPDAGHGCRPPTGCESQLKDLKARVEQDEQRLAAFQREHGLLTTPETLANGQPGETQHTSALLEIDELGRQLVAATTDRILREAEYRAARRAIRSWSSPPTRACRPRAATLPPRCCSRFTPASSELEQEQAQLNIEHGPNFPRVVEIRGQLQDLDRQKKAEDAKLVERFRSAWQTAADREQLVRKNLEEATGEGMKANEAATEYAAMREEANASHELYVRVLEKAEEAGLAAGVQGSNISVVDTARQPVKPVAPDLPLYMAITLFVSLWLAVGGALLLESIHPSVNRAGLVAAGGYSGWRCGPCAGAHAQHLRPAHGRRPLPAPRRIQRPAQPQGSASRLGHPRPKSACRRMAGTQPAARRCPLPSRRATFSISASFTPRSFIPSVRVSPAGTVTLPMIHEVRLGGLDEQAAARAIEAALIAQGMLLHPQVSVLVTSYAGQDVSVLGEVVHPGVYPYTLHHRLLDLISAASGLSPNAGRLVNIFHRDDPKTPHPVVLDPSGTDTASDHNPELAPGDTVQVSRAGLVYVVGDVHPSRRVSRRSGAGADRGAGAFAGLGTDAERRHRQGAADPRTEGRTHHDHAEPETHAARPGAGPAHPRPRHSLRARIRRPRTLEPHHGIGHPIGDRRHDLLRAWSTRRGIREGRRN